MLDSIEKARMMSESGLSRGETPTEGTARNSRKSFGEGLRGESERGPRRSIGENRTFAREDSLSSVSAASALPTVAEHPTKRGSTQIQQISGKVNASDANVSVSEDLKIAVDSDTIGQGEKHSICIHDI